MTRVRSSVDKEGYVQHKLMMSVDEEYIVTDIRDLLAEDDVQKWLAEKQEDGIYEIRGREVGIFRVIEDGSLPLYEVDEVDNVEQILLKCQLYYNEDQPLDYFEVDSGILCIAPSSIFEDTREPREIGAVIDMTLWDPEDFDNREELVNIYENEGGIYLSDMLIARKCIAAIE